MVYPIAFPNTSNRPQLVQAGAVTVTLDGFHANGVAADFEEAPPASEVLTSSTS